ncbi:hypothetical protein [Companilactobacillus zhachilii]|uniref:hypothetical protein n=1 Tax=Companilactobacillus zhachilii TaxID=2304606 RepID=UPI004033FF1F
MAFITVLVGFWNNYAIKIFIHIKVDSYQIILKKDPSWKEQEILVAVQVELTL